MFQKDTVGEFVLRQDWLNEVSLPQTRQAAFKRLGLKDEFANSILLEEEPLDEFATRLVQGIELEFQVLVAGRDAGVADFHEVKYS